MTITPTIRPISTTPLRRTAAAHPILTGALAGFAATAPMTAAMLAMHRMLPPHERYPLPPRRVTMNVADVARVRHHMDESRRLGATVAAHFGYGAAMGGIFAALQRKAPGPVVAKGIAWGLIVWSASYLGLLPALRLHRRATREPGGRNALMIIAHVVWGATLGALTPASSVHNE